MSIVKIFINAHLIDGKSNHSIPNALIVVEEDKIKYVGDYDETIIQNEGNADTYDLEGMTLMPGMIDTHVHLCMGGEASTFSSMVLDTPAYAAIKGAERAKQALEVGFTTLRTMGEKGHIDIAIKRAIEEGIIVGPRIVASGKALTITGGHGDMFPPEVKIDGIGVVVDGADEVRRAAREQLKLGADHIKMMATGGGMSPGPGTVSQLTIQEMEVAVEEAQKFGKITGAHAIGTEGIKNALKAGVRTIEHGTFLDEEGIQLLLEKNAYLVPTLAAFKTLKYGRDGGVPEHHLKKVEYYQTAHEANLKRAILAGVKIVTGTDAGTPFNHHGENAYELECLVKNGLSEMDAIKSATQLAAEALQLSEIGAIECGKIADMIVVAGNPLTNITLLQEKEKIKFVFKGGQLVHQNNVLAEELERKSPTYVS
ncbi:metal-dependent hydrolase family protein [Neobacillus drentensis]|uniref:metal-dependent hydrolase family protein n=1 Tax=Neobacillus drentensis TaxID=220684 RepID=UPI0030026E8F